MMGLDEDVSLEELSIPMTQDTQLLDEVATEVEVVDVQGRASGARTRAPRPNQKRQKKFNVKEDELVVSSWLNVSKDPVQGANQSRASFRRSIYDYYE